MDAIAAAERGFRAWRFSTAQTRSQALLTAAERLRADREAFVVLLIEEARKPRRFALIEVDRAIYTLTWAAGEALRFAGEWIRLDTSATGGGGRGIVERFPRGVILGITPFNFPLNLACHKIAPAIATGNAILIKPSPHTVKISHRLADLFRGALPDGALQVTTPADSEMPALVGDSRIAMVSFTGSDRVGRIIQKQNPHVPHCLELGGNAFAVIAEDVAESELESIATRAVTSAFGFAGQSCISLQNLAVHRKHWSSFMALLRDKVRACPYGDPAHEETVCGPVIDHLAFARIQAELAAAEKKHALTRSQTSSGGSLSPELIPPTLVELSRWEDSSLTQREIFGPVLIAYPFDSLEEFIGQVESSPYGLQCGVFSQSLRTIEVLYQRLSVGGVIVNDMPSTRVDHQPYGGVKSSGEGREGLRYAMEEMTVRKFLSLPGISIR